MGEKKNRVRSIDSIRRSIRKAFLFFLLVILALSLASSSRGIGVALFERPHERALGLDRTGTSLWRAAPPGAAGTRLCADAGEWLLFGIDGLRTHAIAVAIENPSWECRVTAAVLDAPVGREAAAEAGVSAGLSERIRLGAAIRWDTAGLEGCERSSLVTLSLTMLVRMTDRVAVVSRTGNIRLAGEPLPGASASAGVVLSPESMVSAIARLELSPAGGVSFGVASRVRLGGRVIFSLGYEEDTGSLDGSVRVWLGSVAVDAGSSFHPVLGVSQGLYLSWGRGW